MSRIGRARTGCSWSRCSSSAAGTQDLVRRVLVVDCPEEMQVQRVMARSGLTAAEVRAIMATQLSRPERLARADDVLDNAGALAAIAPQVAALDRRYRSMAGAPATDSARL